MVRNVFEKSLVAALVTSLFAAVAGVAGSYALAGYTPSFLVAPITSFLSRVMPDAVLQFAIGPLTQTGQQFGIEHLGQQANLLLGLVLGTGLLASLVLAALATGDRFDSAPAAVSLAGLGTWLAAAVLTGEAVPALGAGVGSAAVVAVAALATATASDADGRVSHGRRTVLGSLGSALGIGVIGYVLGSRGRSQATASVDDNESANVSGGGGSRSTGQLLDIAESRSLDIEGIDSLVSGDQFYEVDINNVNPNVAAEEWTLSVTGSVENELTASYDDLTSMDQEHRFVTLRCVSDPRNGNKMDTALWTGVPIERLIREANPDSGCGCVMARAADDYYQEFPIEALRNGFLAYGMDGETLPRGHGYPVRALIPGHWGEINVKWITEIEVLDEEMTGYWEERGWHGTGPVNTVAKLRTTNRLDDGRIEVGGHAYAGTRGIERVEISTDGGDSWTETDLSEPLPAGTDKPDANAAEDAWRQWRHVYDAPGEQHDAVVRAVDGTGTLQPRERTGPHPRGASGWVSRTIGQ